MPKHKEITGDQLHHPRARVGLDADKGSPGWDGDAYFAHDTAILYVGRGGAWEPVSGLGAELLDDLSDVNTTGKADGDLLAWDAGAGQWQARTGFGTLPADFGQYVMTIDGATVVSTGGEPFFCKPG